MKNLLVNRIKDLQTILILFLTTAIFPVILNSMKTAHQNLITNLLNVHSLTILHFTPYSQLLLIFFLGILFKSISFFLIEAFS